MATREQNEQDYPSWGNLPDGDRRYWVDKPGRARGFARYIKVVDANEVTQSFVQGVYDKRWPVGLKIRFSLLLNPINDLLRLMSYGIFSFIWVQRTPSISRLHGKLFAIGWSA
jgi:hypothetical protein